MTPRFGALLLDPPWRYIGYNDKRSVPSRQSVDPYSTMTLDEMKALPVGEIAADRSAMFLWVIDSHLDQALELGRSYGFKFQTCAFVWVKCKRGGHPTIGMGRWTRKQTEQCWLFTRGRPPRLSGGVEQIIFAPRGPHSAKPEEQYRRIEALVDGPYLEMWARTRRRRWWTWGNEIGKGDGALFDHHGIPSA